MKSRILELIYPVVLLAIAIPIYAAVESTPVDTTVLPIRAWDENAMMGNMYMNPNVMAEMFRQCKEMHRDDRLCDDQTMMKCQQTIGRSDCAKMLSAVKAKEKANQNQY